MTAGSWGQKAAFLITNEMQVVESSQKEDIDTLLDRVSSTSHGGIPSCMFACITT